ncbi:MAG: hypothetical protein F6J96_13445 [Symploca sp. SIO1C2]|nr:hypothetical protein [Symploca sp. SIO1C2]
MHHIIGSEHQQDNIRHALGVIAYLEVLSNLNHSRHKGERSLETLQVYSYPII